MPSWDVLYEIAAAQRGYFTASQARDAGYSTALLRHYVRTGQDAHVRHGIYRLTKFPMSSHEEMIVEWLWSGREGVFSHESALSLYEVSDVLPEQFHLTVPTAWRGRRMRIPDGVVLYYADLPAADRQRLDGVPVTSVRRALEDCATTHLSPEFLKQGLTEALARGLVLPGEVAALSASLERFA